MALCCLTNVICWKLHHDAQAADLIFLKRSLYGNNYTLIVFNSLGRKSSTFSQKINKQLNEVLKILGVFFPLVPKGSGPPFNIFR